MLQVVTLWHWRVAAASCFNFPVPKRAIDEPRLASLEAWIYSGTWGIAWARSLGAWKLIPESMTLARSGIFAGSGSERASCLRRGRIRDYQRDGVFINRAPAAKTVCQISIVAVIQHMMYQMPDATNVPNPFAH